MGGPGSGRKKKRPDVFEQTPEQQDWDRRIDAVAYKDPAEADDATKRLWAVELKRCEKSFLRFLRWVKIVEAPTPGHEGSGGVIPFQIWPHLKSAIVSLLTRRKIVWLKSRQIGASWLVAAYCLWFAMFRVGAVIMYFSKGELEAAELLAKSKRVFESLPAFMWLKHDPWSTTEIGFPFMKSSIKAMPATEAAGISFQASIIVSDEWEQHQYAAENYTNAKPTIDAGGQYIGIFTRDKMRGDTLATSVFQEALEGTNGFTPLFTTWHARPGRDQKWYEDTKRNIPKRELGNLTPELYMAQNYPGSIEEALRPLQTVAAFDFDALNDLLQNVRNPITIMREGLDTKVCSVFQDMILGHPYIAATDTSHGVGKDFSVSVVLDCKTGAVVADILDNRLPPEDLSFHTIRLLEVYKKPLWFIERNDWGAATILAAENMGYTRLGYEDPDKKTKVGFDTHSKSRLSLWAELIQAINNRQVTIFNQAGLKQFWDIIRNVHKEGRIEAMSSRHDDYPMAVGIAWLKREEAGGTSESLPRVHLVAARAVNAYERT